MAKTLLPLASSGVFVPASAEAVAADIERLDGAVSDLAEDVGALEQLDAGDIPFDPDETYASGSVGNTLSDVKSDLSNLGLSVVDGKLCTTYTE